ncbi:hypothetical protein BGW38_005888, partial [Lunasporangiospora selenospora]
MRQWGTLSKEVGTLRESGLDYVVKTILRVSFRSTKKHYLDHNDHDIALQPSQNPKQSKRVSYGRDLSLADLITPGYSSPKNGYMRNKPMAGNLQSSVGSSLPSTDKDDTSYCTDQDLRESTSKVYTWNYLEGNGRLDSRVDTAWKINDIDVGGDLMDFRDRVVQENGGATEPHEKLTQTQEDTRNEDSGLLIPDFSTRSVAQKRELSLVLLEGKVSSNKGSQIWDDRTKLGQEMKLALDSILMLQPKDNVCVVGLLVREPLAEFFVMELHAEGAYIMRRFAACFIPTDPMNMFSIVSMMETFQHVQEK